MNRELRITLLIGLVMELMLLGAIGYFIAHRSDQMKGGHHIYVDFGHVENLHEGAAVRLSHLQLGRIVSLRHYAHPGEPKLFARLRADVWIADEYWPLIKSDSLFYITAPRLVSERHLEMQPSSITAPEKDPSIPSLSSQAQDGQVFRGIDGPNVDRLVQYGYQTLRNVMDIMHDLAPEGRKFAANMSALRQHLKEVPPAEQTQSTWDKLVEFYRESSMLVDLLRLGSNNWKLLKSLMNHVDALVTRSEDEISALGPRLVRLEQQFDQLGLLFDEKNQKKASRASRKISESTERLFNSLEQTEALLKNLEQGRGTIGRLMQDPQINDEIKETQRIIKQTPWKTLGKPNRGKPPRRPSR